MKKNIHKVFIATIIALMIANYAFSQWGTNGSDIYNNNSGKLGISSTGNFTTPGFQIDCKGDINLNGSSNALRIAGNIVLWNNGTVGNIFVGANAGNATTLSGANTFMGNKAGIATTTGSAGTFIGYESGTANADAVGNTAIGYQAMHSNVSLLYNTAIGYQALFTNSSCGDCYLGTSATNTACGYQTLYTSQAYGGCAFGFWAGKSNTTGCSTTAFGENALLYNTAGNDNVGVGGQASVYNKLGSANTCVGDAAGHGVQDVSNFSNNSFFGANAGQGMTTGNDNAFMGRNAGYSTTTGSLNTFIGDSSGYKNTTGSDNVLLGFKTGYSNISGGNNIFMGYLTGYSSTTAGSDIFIGNQAAYTNTTGSADIAIGTTALYKNTTGASNVAIGYAALYTNISGGNNTACGYGALQYNTGDFNAGFGRLALNTNTTGYYNIGCGTNTLYANTTGYQNTACGMDALHASTTGYYNTACGNGALYYNSSGTGHNNTALGYYTDVSGSGLNNATAIGNGATATATNMMYLGNASTNIYCVSGLITGSDGRFKTNVTENVKGLSFIKKLRPVTYNMNTQALDDFLIQNLPDSLKPFHKAGMDFTASSAIIHSGFIAQEVEQAAQQVGFTSSIVHAPDNSNTHYGLNYAEIVVPLVKAVQELSKTSDSLQTKKIMQDSINAAVQNAQQKKINTQDSINTALQNQINQLMATINACCTAHTTKSMQQNTDMQTAANQTDVELSNKNIVVLDQNIPNPFAEQTVINYFLPDNFVRAQIIFVDQSGKLIKAVDLTEKGKGQLNVFANDLTSGIYTYSLIVDGQTMETKKMVKAK